MLSKFKRNKHQQHLAQLPKLSQSVDDIEFFYAPADFRQALLAKIAHATQRICIIALYLEQDDGGKGILQALYDAKRQRPELDVCVLVDWHRAQRTVSARQPPIPMPIGTVAWPRKTQGLISRCMASRSIPGKRSACFILKASSSMTALFIVAPA